MEKVVVRTTLHGIDGTLRYWLARPPAERIAAVEELRRSHLGLTPEDAEPRLQRVCRVAQRQRGSKDLADLESLRDEPSDDSVR